MGLGASAAFLFLASCPAPAQAWGYEGHEIIAAIARSYLTPATRQKVDALLAEDTDALTASDMVSRATWADAYRSTHKETADWHFVDVELDHPDLKVACFGQQALGGTPASQGPAEDCVVDKVRQFVGELADPTTSQPERILALKFVLHFVGDEHQPLHAADNHDKGGNCVRIALGGSRTTTLHGYWDTTVVQALGSNPHAVAGRLSAQITPAMKADWEEGDPIAWAMQSYRLAKSQVYSLNFPPGCPADAPPWSLSPSYEAAAKQIAILQLQRAGVRLALTLNRSLKLIQISQDQAMPLPAPGRSGASLTCSAEADAKGLHGHERQDFRSQCKRQLGRFPVSQ